MRVLGIDTSLRSTGVAVVESKGSRLSAVASNTIRIPANKPRTVCLCRLAEGLAEIIKDARPEAVAIEGGFYFKNARTALTLGEARGAAISTCAAANLPIYEYAPRRVKQAVVGYGSADKSQVMKMVMQILGLTSEPQQDAADALALAITHLHSASTHAELMPKPI